MQSRAKLYIRPLTCRKSKRRKRFLQVKGRTYKISNKSLKISNVAIGLRYLLNVAISSKYIGYILRCRLLHDLHDRGRRPRLM